MAGRIARSSPTIAPTNALMTTSSANCGRFSRRPSRTGGATVTRMSSHDSGQRCRAAIERQDLLHLLGLGWYVGERGNERVAILRQHRIPSPLERDRARRLAAEPGTAHGSREMTWVDLDVV